MLSLRFQLSACFDRIFLSSRKKSPPSVQGWEAPHQPGTEGPLLAKGAEGSHQPGTEGPLLAKGAEGSHQPGTEGPLLAKGAEGSHQPGTEGPLLAKGAEGSHQPGTEGLNRPGFFGPSRQLRQEALLDGALFLCRLAVYRAGLAACLEGRPRGLFIGPASRPFLFCQPPAPNLSARSVYKPPALPLPRLYASSFYAPPLYAVRQAGSFYKAVRHGNLQPARPAFPQAS